MTSALPEKKGQMYLCGGSSRLAARLVGGGRSGTGQQFWRSRRFLCSQLDSGIFFLIQAGEHKLNPVRNSELVKNSEQIVLHGVFGQIQPRCNLPIGKAFN